MASQRNISVAYCAVEKYFGVYAPAGAAAFSLCTIWWTYSAASAGIICSREPAAAPKARGGRMSGRVMDSFMGEPQNKKGEDLTQSSRRKRGKRIGRGGKAPPLQACI